MYSYIKNIASASLNPDNNVALDKVVNLVTFIILIVILIGSRGVIPV